MTYIGIVTTRTSARLLTAGEKSSLYTNFEFGLPVRVMLTLIVNLSKSKLVIILKICE